MAIEKFEKMKVGEECIICINPKWSQILEFSPRFGQNFQHTYL